MATIKNRVQLIGHLGSDPEIKTTETGKKMARISIATNESYKNASGEWVKDTQWHQLVVWGKLAETLAEKLHKGMEAVVEGKLIHREYIDKTGAKKYVTEVQVTDIHVPDKK